MPAALPLEIKTDKIVDPPKNDILKRVKHLWDASARLVLSSRNGTLSASRAGPPWSRRLDSGAASRSAVRNNQDLGVWPRCISRDCVRRAASVRCTSCEYFLDYWPHDFSLRC